jgi:SAM-dependent methyltransferase
VAVKADFEYFNFVFSKGLVAGPVLEIGGRSWQGEAGNLESLCKELGIGWESADIDAGPGVTYQLDILDQEATRSIGRTWSTVAVFNLLEHVYNPILALENATELLEPGGICIVAGPAIWQLHQFPGDFWRPLPDFFIEFGRRNELDVSSDLMFWLVYGKIYPVSRFRSNHELVLPSVDVSKSIYGAYKSLRSRILHRLFRTYGREMAFPYVGLGVVLKKRGLAQN